MYYHSVDLMERTLAAVGLTTGYGGGGAAYASFRYLNDTKKSRSL